MRTAGPSSGGASPAAGQDVTVGLDADAFLPFSGRHRLRRVGGEFRMRAETVVLANAAEPLPNLTSLI